VSDYDSDISPDELVELYVATKSRLFSIDPDLADIIPSRKRPKSITGYLAPQSGGIRKLTDRLQRIESDMLFDKDVANRKWSVERINLARQRATQKRLTNCQDTSGSETESSHVTPLHIAAVLDDLSSTSEDDILGDMFLAPNETSAPKSSGSAGDVSVTLRNFGKATGFNPRRLLEDACRARYSCFCLVTSSS
jgi:ATP-dependent RNA helicase DHX29